MTATTLRERIMSILGRRSDTVFKGEKTGYEYLLNEQAEVDDAPTSVSQTTTTSHDHFTTNNSHKRVSILHSLCYITILIFAILGVLAASQLAITAYQTAHPPSCNCGTNLVEARALGCKYDSVAAGWLPTACRDDALTAEFDAAGPNPDGSWDYWADPDRHVRLNVSQVALLGGTVTPFYATQEWHIMHCTYNWRKTVRAAQTGVRIERHAAGLGHVRHCEDIFTREYKMQDLRTISGIRLDLDHGH